MITGSVVVFNTPQEQLDLIFASFCPSKDRILYLVDNGSSFASDADLLRNRFPAGSIQIIQNKKNLGYGGGHNVAIKKALDTPASYHIVLNPDLRFDPNVLDDMVDYADQHPDVVSMMPKVKNPQGEVQYLCKLLPTPTDLFFRRFFLRGNDRNVALSEKPSKTHIQERDRYYTLRDVFDYDHVINPPCLSGCFMFLRTKTLRDNDLMFDERFFMYCEDFDLVRRLHIIGKTIYYPDVEIIHDHGRASYHSVSGLIQHCRSAIKYFNKWGWFHDDERDQMNNMIRMEIEKCQ